jgi:hypothetical protein
VTVQAAFNCPVDNYLRLADWVFSANRVGALLELLDGLHRHASAERPDRTATMATTASATMDFRSGLSSFRVYPRESYTAHRRGGELKRSQSESSSRKDDYYKTPPYRT